MQTYQKYNEEEDMIINEYDVPNELLLLLEVLGNVKTLEISISEATHESIITYLLILFNSEWIFTMVFNLILDLSCPKVNNEILSVYKKKFNKFYSNFLNSDELTDLEIIDKILENIQKEKEDKLKNKDKNAENDKKNKKAEKEALKLQEKENKDFNEMLSKTYPNIIKNNSNVFDTLLLLINFIKKLPFINKLVVNIPDGYNIEINDYLRLKLVPGVEKIQFVDFLSTINNFKTVDIANAVMTKFNPLQDFSNIAQKYLAPIEPLVSVEQVNDWCSNKTHGKIKKILDELTDDTAMILLNAVYFKGEWSSKFESSLSDIFSLC